MNPLSGVLSALIKQLFDWRKDRVQPLRYRSEVARVGMETSKTIRIVVTDPQGATHVVPYFFIAEITLTNRSSRDYSGFTFGLTLPYGLTAIEVEIKTPPGQEDP